MLAPLNLEPTPIVEIERFPQWYVLQTEPQRENSANGYLIGRRVRTYLPVVPQVTTRGIRRAKVTVHKPMFRGYLFVHLDLRVDQRACAACRSAPGVHRFVKFAATDHFAIISDKDMRHILDEEEKASDPATYVSRFAVGERVRVSDGPFAGHNVEICELGDEERIKVLVSLLQREVLTEMDPLILEKL